MSPEMSRDMEDFHAMDPATEMEQSLSLEEDSGNCSFLSMNIASDIIPVAWYSNTEIRDELWHKIIHCFVGD